ncbi:hypothetical protein AB0H28_27920 [Micromonospora sp. NPDC050980]|uniref:hypothetical protein n=1 Tax=Micromonospora sp. NPDC050980 TaxID=3155161 RepID=UPI0033FC80E4
MPGLIGIATARAGDYGGATYTRSSLPTSGLTAPYDATRGVISDGFHVFVTPSLREVRIPGGVRQIDQTENVVGRNVRFVLFRRRPLWRSPADVLRLTLDRAYCHYLATT